MQYSYRMYDNVHDYVANISALQLQIIMKYQLQYLKYT